jgi:glycosyltransferase involved in cell wall biosynthesis
MKLSVIIPTKNEERCLPALLKQLKEQTLQPFEVIIADAKSEDRTVEIAKRSGAKVVDGGLPGPGRNAGARAAKGDLLLFLDADISLNDPHQLQRAVHQFEKRALDIATVDIAPANGNSYDRFSHKIYSVYVRLWGSRNAHAPGFFILVRRSLHNTIEGFDETVLFCEDHDYAKRGSKKGKFGILEDVPVHVSVRRMDRDGRMNIAIKFLLAELHLIFLGPIRHDKFNYTFGHNLEKYGRKK